MPSPGPHPVVVLIHGGYWRARYGLDLMNALAADMVSRGFVVWNLEYRRIHNPGGGWPGTFEDVAAGFDALVRHAERYQVDLSRVVVVGHSAGGHLALWLAARRQLTRGPGAAPALVPSGVIALAAVSDLHQANELKLSDNAVAELLGGDYEQVPERYRHTSPMHLLPLGVRQLLVHGTADDMVPRALTENYASAAAVARDACASIQLPDVNHVDVIDPSSTAWAAIAPYLADFTGSAAPSR